MKRATRDTFTVVQALRGIAASWVVLFHASEGGHIPELHGLLPHAVSLIIFDFGHLGVAIFFALSGFVISHSLRQAGDLNSRVFARFMARRSIRLDPPYWASIALVVLVGIISADVKHESPLLPSLPRLLAHAVYLQGIFDYPQIDNVYWTLCYEFQFYAFFAAALVFGRAQAGGAAMLALAVASALNIFDVLPHGVFLDLWGCFYVGVLSREAVDNRKQLMALALLFLTLIAMGDAFGTISAITALFLWAAASRGYATDGLNWRWLQFLGTISYSLYLVHNPVSGASGFIAHKLFGRGVGPDLAVLATIVSASIAAATAFWLTVELPSHRLSRRVSIYR